MADDRREREIRRSGAPSAVQPDPPAEVERLREEVQRLREEQDRQRSALSAAGNGSGDGQGTSTPAQSPHQEPQTQKRGQAAPADEDEDKPKRPWYREHPIKALVGLIVLIAIAVGVVWYWQYSQTFESTDDAQIDAHLNAVSTQIP